MTFHYGPTTCFITLSPGEWLWEDLGSYLHEMNPEMNDLTISAMLLWIQFQHRDLLTTNLRLLLFNKVSANKCPLGNVIHHCVRRE